MSLKQDDREEEQPSEREDIQLSHNDLFCLAGASEETAAEAVEDVREGHSTLSNTPSMRGGSDPEPEAEEEEEGPQRRLKFTQPPRRSSASLGSRTFEEYYQGTRVRFANSRLGWSPPATPPRLSAKLDRQLSSSAPNDVRPTPSRSVSEFFGLPSAVSEIIPSVADYFARTPGSGVAGRRAIREEREREKEMEKTRAQCSARRSEPFPLVERSYQKGLSMADVSMDFGDCAPDSPTLSPSPRFSVSSDQSLSTQLSESSDDSFSFQSSESRGRSTSPRPSESRGRSPSSLLKSMTNTFRDMQWQAEASTPRRRVSEYDPSSVPVSAVPQELENSPPDKRPRADSASTAPRRDSTMTASSVPGVHFAEPDISRSQMRASLKMTPIAEPPITETPSNQDWKGKGKAYVSEEPGTDKGDESLASVKSPKKSDADTGGFTKAERRESFFNYWRSLQHQHRPAFSAAA